MRTNGYVGGMPVLIAAAVFLLIVVAITVPAGYGLPAPLFALVALAASVPGLIASWFVYRALVRRGEITPLGAGPHEGLENTDLRSDEGDTSDGERPTHRVPNREQPSERGRFFPSTR